MAWLQDWWNRLSQPSTPTRNSGYVGTQQTRAASRQPARSEIAQPRLQRAPQQQQTNRWGTPLSQPMALGEAGVGRQGTTRTAAQPDPNREVNVFEEFGRWAGDVGRNFNDFMNQPVYSPADAFRDSAIEQGTKKGKNMNPFALDPKTGTWTLESPFGNAETIQPKHEQNVAKTVEKVAFQEPEPMQRTEQRLTDEQWAQLTPEQQQGVVANWTLYQASLADKALDQKGGWDADYTSNIKDIFGDENRGSDYYAPNLVRALNELGYTDKNSDLDYWLNGSTYSSYEDILGQTKGTAADARRSIYTNLQGSGVFDEEPVIAAMSNGSNLLESLRYSDVLSGETLGYAGAPKWAADSLAPEDMAELDQVLDFMQNREQYDFVQTDKEAADEFNANMADLERRIDPNLMNQYFVDMLEGDPGDENYFSREEFMNNWLKRREG